MSRPVSWDDQRIFLAVLDEGSLSAAARLLGITQPTVRARIETLEEAIGARLFTRSVHGLTPTDQARALGASARAMAFASNAFVRAASSDMSSPTGTVRIGASEAIGSEVLPPMLMTLQAEHPEISIELDLSNESADLLNQQVDIAIRNYEPTQAALITRKIRPIDVAFYAHRTYVARHGVPETRAELLNHRLIGPDRSTADLSIARSLFPELGPTHFRFRTDSHIGQLALLRAGLGIGTVQTPIGDADPDLIRILPDLVVLKLDSWIVTHEDLRLLPRIRAVFDHLVDAFDHYARKSAVEVESRA